MVGERCVGYVIADVLDVVAHVEQISVLPTYQNRGIGKAVLAAVERWGRAQGYTALTLMTFTEVPWNRPLYEHVGFRVIPEEILSNALRRLRAVEAAERLDPAQRVVMRREIPN
jgi:GNAT superfamily N-acetyltransferase